MISIIAINSVTVRLGKGYKALDAVTLDLPAGKIIGFIGPSGAGKTTLIRSIVGRQKLSAGTVSVLGKPAGNKLLRSKVRYMTQELSIYSDLTCKENIRYFAKIAGYHGKQLDHETKKVLEAVRLNSKAEVLAGSLSGGQKQRLSLAIALLGDPELLVLDEPTVGLDPVLREELWELFRSIRDAGKSIIISSHVMDEAERCDELVLLRDAKVVASGSPTELCRRTGTRTVEQSFLKFAEGSVT